MNAATVNAESRGQQYRHLEYQDARDAPFGRVRRRRSRSARAAMSRWLPSGPPGIVPWASQALSDRTARATRGSDAPTVTGVSPPDGMSRIRPSASLITELSGR